MGLRFRQMGPGDRDAWVGMRVALWPDETAAVHAADVAALLAGTAAGGFVAETDKGEAVGFAEISIRPFADGCDSRPVPFLEGIWVDARFRRQGIGARLIEQVEAFVTARGFREIGSDAHLENQASHAAHRRWGFAETERVVRFRKLLTAQT